MQGFEDHDIQWVKPSRLYSFLCADHTEKSVNGSTVRNAEAHDWFGKRDDPHYARLVEDLATHGFTAPVSVNYVDGFNVLADGHHRVAAAFELDILVPITYDYVYAADAKWGCGKDTYEIFQEV